MKKIQLKKQELKKVNTMITEYRRIEDSLTEIQKKLEELEKDKELLLESLDSNREAETKFFEELKKQYGEGKFDLHTNQYIVTQ